MQPAPTRRQIVQEALGSLILGTARYPSPAVLEQAVVRAGVRCVTVSLRRENQAGSGRGFFRLIEALGVQVLPNTAGCRTAQEAVTTAQMARDLFGTPRIKLEVIGGEETLHPDVFETVRAAETLNTLGFEVFPYTTEDMSVAEQLVRVGCSVLMPWGSLIGSGAGVAQPEAIARLRKRFPDVFLVVDAGLGAPSHAAFAMELGADAVLLNTAVAEASDPPLMAEAFAKAVEGGRSAYRSGLMPKRNFAVASTPLEGLAHLLELGRNGSGS